MQNQHNRVGLGTFPLANVFRQITREGAKSVVRRFLDSGGYFIDTAPLYGFGEVESLLGEVLSSYPRDRYAIDTKCGYIDVEGKTFQSVVKSGKYDDVMRECDRSLTRLKLDYIDTYYMHSPDPNTPVAETMRALTHLKATGKIRSIGVSNVNLEELTQYNTNGDIAYIQNRYSMLNRSIPREMDAYLTTHKIRLVPYQIIERGQLTGSVFEGIGQLRDGDIRISKSDWKPETISYMSEWVRKSIAPIADNVGITIGQLSLAWALHQQYVEHVIVGLTNPQYIGINFHADTTSLDGETLEKLDHAYSQLENDIRIRFGKSIREFRGLNEKYY